jgi:hypothetical protein
MAALTASQLELLRRLRAGDSLYDCKDIPHFLEEIVLLARLGLIAIHNDGSPTVTAQGAAYEHVAKGLSEFAPLADFAPLEAPPSLSQVATPDRPLPLAQVIQA